MTVIRFFIWGNRAINIKWYLYVCLDMSEKTETQMSTVKLEVWNFNIFKCNSDSKIYFSSCGYFHFKVDFLLPANLL